MTLQSRILLILAIARPAWASALSHPGAHPSVWLQPVEFFDEGATALRVDGGYKHFCGGLVCVQLKAEREGSSPSVEPPRVLQVCEAVSAADCAGAGAAGENAAFSVQLALDVSFTTKESRLTLKGVLAAGETAERRIVAAAVPLTLRCRGGADGGGFREVCGSAATLLAASVAATHHLQAGDVTSAVALFLRRVHLPRCRERHGPALRSWAHALAAHVGAVGSETALGRHLPAAVAFVHAFARQDADAAQLAAVALGPAGERLRGLPARAFAMVLSLAALEWDSRCVWLYARVRSCVRACPAGRYRYGQADERTNLLSFLSRVLPVPSPVRGSRQHWPLRAITPFYCCSQVR